MVKTNTPLNESLQAGGLLDELFDEIARRIETGEAVDLEAYADRYPQQAGQIRQFLPTMQALVDLGMSAEVSRISGSSTSTGDGFRSGVLGDFRIIREVGRGGMGVVYEAEQISLGRRVALKILPLTALLDDRHLQRFQNEARAAASLNHPHIVSVHAVGCERGVHYYAMDLIQGQTLTELITLRHREEVEQHDQRSSTLDPPYTTSDPLESAAAFRDTPGSQIDRDTVVYAELSTRPGQSDASFFLAAARLGLQAADALEHAHQMGVVHRDIKPSNLLIDQRGHLWIADFGLARVDGDATLTLTGDVIGTLRYMSPEQALGNNTILDQRTDIYSLGVTLYELVTGKPAFPETDRNVLMRRVAEEEPIAPRTLNPQIPYDLETIILTAIDKDPALRYRSAAKLSEDLKAFLETKPIAARRPSLWHRAAKWSRRNRRLVAVAIAASCLLLVAVLIGIGALADKNSELRSEREQLRNEQRRTTALAEVGKQALDRLYEQAVRTWDGRTSMYGAEYRNLVGDTERTILEETARLYEQLARNVNHDDRVDVERATTLRRLGTAQLLLGNSDAARITLKQALALLNRYAADNGGDIETNRQIASCYEGLGILSTGKERTDHYLKSRDLRLQFASVEERPDDVMRLSRVTSKVAISFEELAENSRADTLHQEAVQHSADLVSEYPDRDEYRAQYASNIGNYGSFMFNVNEDLDESIRLHRIACRELELVTGRDRRNYLAKTNLAHAYTNLGRSLSHRVPDESLEVLEKATDAAIELLEDITDDATTTRLADISLILCRPEFRDTPDRLERAIALQTKINTAIPNNAKSFQELVRNYEAMMKLLLDQGNLDEAIRWGRAGVQLVKQQGDHCGDPLLAAYRLAAMRAKLVLVLFAARRHDETLKTLETIYEESPTNAELAAMGEDRASLRDPYDFYKLRFFGLIRYVEYLGGSHDSDKGSPQQLREVTEQAIHAGLQITDPTVVGEYQADHYSGKSAIYFAHYYRWHATALYAMESDLEVARASYEKAYEALAKQIGDDHPFNRGKVGLFLELQLFSPFPELRDDAQSLALAQRWMKERPADTQGWFDLGWSLLRHQQYEEADAAFQHYFEMEGNRDGGERLGHAIAKYHLGQRQAAEEIYRDGISQLESSPWLSIAQRVAQEEAQRTFQDRFKTTQPGILPNHRPFGP